jgi:Icc-related predicted phosphoesterase
MKDDTVLLVGDLHGNTDVAINAIEYAADLGVFGVIQLGDFGYWPRVNRDFMGTVERTAKRCNVVVAFLDGNHEDHESLASFENSDHVAHLKRGESFPLHGYKWLAIGGAASIDYQHRTEGISWFREETLSREDIARAMDHTNVQVVVAHNAPHGVPKLEAFKEKTAHLWSPEGLAYSEGDQKLYGALRDHLLPYYWYHGHFHYPYVDYLDNTRVQGLGSDQSTLMELCQLVYPDGSPAR